MLITDNGDFLLVLRFTLVTQADLLGESIIFSIKICWNNSQPSLQCCEPFWAINEQHCRELIELFGRHIDQLTDFTQSHSE